MKVNQSATLPQRTQNITVRSLNTVCNDLQLVLVDHRTIPQTLLQTYEIADAGQLCCGTYPILLAVGIGLCMQTDD